MTIKNNLLNLIDSQAHFAEQIGMDRGNLNKIVNGHLPRYTTMLQIAKVLNKKVDDVWFEVTTSPRTAKKKVTR